MQSNKVLIGKNGMGGYGMVGRCFRMCGCMILIDRLLRKSSKYGVFPGLGIYILK